MAEHWYKATRKGGVSFRDPTFVYHLGMNVHPEPDKSNTLCSRGIHLANWEEIYIVEPGVILAEDDDKARVASCFVIRMLSTNEIGIDKIEPSTEPLCGWDWLKKHSNDITQSMWNEQGIEIIADRNKVNIKATVKPKDIKVAIGAVVKK
jgi:hypothetical protein